MKKKSLIIGSVVIIVAAILLLAIQPWGKKPFKDLSVHNITSVSVELLPPQKSFDLSGDDIAELTAILNSVVIYNKDSSHTQYAGQAVIYTIIKTDGTILTVNAYNPFLVIDNVGYKTKYEPCQELNTLGNKILNDE